MTVSGVKTYNPTTVDIITDAHRECGIIASVETPSAEQLINGRNKLNRMVSEWMRMGHKVWAIEEGIVFLQKGQRRYLLGSGSTDHYTDAYDYASTTLTAGAAAGATALTVASIAGIANADALAIELDTGEFQWTSVNGAPAGTTVTAAAVLTGAAAAGNRVIAYTSRFLKPLEVQSSRHFDYVTQNEIRINELAHVDFMEQPNKTQQASPAVQWRYQPKVDVGILETWLTPANVKYAARITYKRMLFDFTENAQTADFPIEWANALIFGLAAELIPGGNVPPKRAEFIMGMAGSKLANALGNDRPQGSFYFQPDDEYG